MPHLKESDIEVLLTKLQSEGLMPVEQAETLIHAFSDIADSMKQIYDVLLPKLLASKTREEFQDALWDIREEFRHVEYHLEDAKLADL